MQTNSLAVVIGQNARNLRLDSGVTLDAVASAARDYGLKWSTARVVEFEKGRLPVSAAMLIVIAHILGSVTGRALSLGDLVVTDDWVELTPNFSLSGSATLRAFNGEPIGWSLADVKSVKETASAMVTSLEDFVDDVERFLPAGTTFGDLREIHRPTLAEKRAADRLGIPAYVVSWWAERLWSHSIDDESAQRAGGDASAQRRGAVTRELVREIGRQIHG